MDIEPKNIEQDGVIAMFRKLVAAAAAAALLVAACSSDDDESTPTEPAATEDTGPTTASAAPSTDAPETTGAAPATEAPADSAAPTTTADESADAGNGDVQYESLSTRPWASPDDAHETPEAAVEAFLEFATGDAAGGLFNIGDVAVGDYREGDARSGEVTVQFVQQFTDTTSSTSVLPVITVMVRQAGPQDTWWVVAAVTDGLTVAAPVADAEIGTTFDIDLTNDMIVADVQQRLFEAGDDAPLYTARIGGSGIFTTGRHAATLDTTSCDDVDAPETPAIDFVVGVCDGPGTPGAEGTLVVVSDAGITTVPIVFAE